MVGSECLANPPILNASTGVGYLTNIAGVNSYVSGSPLAILTIVLISDIFGFEPPLLRKIADKVANHGYFVVVPDFFHGEPYNAENASRPLNSWLKDHNSTKGIETAKPIIEALKRKGASAVGVAGFCWGARTATKLGITKLVEASVILHPSSVTVDEIRGVEVPIAILAAEHDSFSPPKLIKKFKQVLDAKPEIDSYVKIFANVSHGWTVRYDPNDPKAVKDARKAHKIMINWFDRHLKK
ncbi:hypothetical protein PHAVU_005G150700 [Phaseolus vulgaris]|uniref:Dienelactone hydrolase domain-containing protein n=1 Tax=Phaseolus vulgaris TaxID=3885 RepID=V7BZB4_PHAVU|nr:hypothetical protein PHAVU_005G150700g [Phaseolus vulgaris]ESW22400.1 hypothetical protein PHAVU_005G150700g [Phaseolus vulgaris]